MELGTAVMAATSWPDAAVAIAGVALVGAVVVVVVWQALATWRARIDAARERAYLQLAERTAQRLDEISEHIRVQAGDAR